MQKVFNSPVSFWQNIIVCISEVFENKSLDSLLIRPSLTMPQVHGIQLHPSQFKAS